MLHYALLHGFPYASIVFALGHGGNVREQATYTPIANPHEIVLGAPRSLNAFEYAIMGGQSAPVLQLLLDEDTPVLSRLEAEHRRRGGRGVGPTPLLHIGNYADLLGESVGPSRAFLLHWKSIFDRRRHALSTAVKSRRARGGRRQARRTIRKRV